MFVWGRAVLVFVASVALCSGSGLAQKIKVGVDKTADFSKYKSFTVQKPAKEPAHPLLYAHIVGSIEQELTAKGIAPAEKDGDLVLMLTGGTDFSLENAPASSDCPNCKAPILDPGDWPGSTAPPGVGSKPMPEGMLELNFVDRATNKSVWMGWVEQKIDPDKKSKAFDKADKAIQKLLKDFPPKK